MIYKDFYPFYTSYANPLIYRGEKEDVYKRQISLLISAMGLRISWENRDSIR